MCMLMLKGRSLNWIRHGLDQRKSCFKNGFKALNWMLKQWMRLRKLSIQFCLKSVKMLRDPKEISSHFHEPNFTFPWWVLLIRGVRCVTETNEVGSIKHEIYKMKILHTNLWINRISSKLVKLEIKIFYCFQRGIQKFF